MPIILNLWMQCLEMRIYGFNITLIIVACRLGRGEQYLLFLIFQEGGSISPTPLTLLTSPISPQQGGTISHDAIIGIIVGVLGLLVIAGGLIFCWTRRRQRATG